MELKNWIPWNRKHEVDVRRDGGDRIHALQSDINRAFEDFWRSFNVPFFTPPSHGLLSDSTPRMEVAESDDEVEVSVELPGMSEEDIDLSLTDNLLTITGERKSEREEKRKDCHVREWSYGSVHRSVPLPNGLNLDDAKARFRNGILTVTLPKNDDARARVRRITVN